LIDRPEIGQLDSGQSEIGQPAEHEPELKPPTPDRIGDAVPERPDDGPERPRDDPDGGRIEDPPPPQ